MVLHVVLGLLLAAEGALILIRALTVEHDSLLVAFGAVELISAALFVWPRSVLIGASGLVCVSLVAAVFHVIHGEFPSEHLVAAVAAAFVTMHTAGWSSPFGRAAA